MKVAGGLTGLSAVLAIALCAGVRADENCPAPPEWFPVTPKPTNNKPNPDEDCEFYQWAWQDFLYLTQPEAGHGPELRFLTYDTPTDLFAEPSTPRFKKKPKGKLLLTPRLAKQSHAKSLSEFLQADSKGAIVDQNGRIVYYALHVNQEFVKFVDDHQFRTVENIARAPADLEFPKGCLELKSSWKVLGPNDDRSKFLVRDADVAVLTLQNGKPTIDRDHTRPEKVGLVGLHVVGVVDGHPEFIWATFEHNDNAPNLVPGTSINGDQPVDSSRSFTFYPQGTPAKQCNKKQALTFVSEPNQTFTPSTPVCREFPFGGEPKEDEAITSLNKNVYAMIDARAPALALWKNYRLTGAIWLNNPAYFRENVNFAADDASHPKKLILGGEKKLSNATMETFTQGVKVNCFSCHTTTAVNREGMEVFAPKRIGVSHILVNAYIFAHTPN